MNIYNHSVEQSKMNIYQYSIQRSGSTLVYNIIRWIYALLPYNVNIIKGHGMPRPCVLPSLKKMSSEEIEKHINKSYIVITQRDPRDCVASNHRILKGKGGPTPPMSRLDIIKLSRCTEEEITAQLEDVHPYAHVLWLRYENFVNDYEHIYDALEGFFNIVIDKKLREVITEHCNMATMKKLSDTIEPTALEPTTKMLYNHIGSGKIGLWDDLTPYELRGLLNDRLSSVMKLWAYND